MLFNGGGPLGACSDLLPPHGDVAVGSEGEIFSTQVGEEVQKRQIMDGGRGAVCRDCFASPWGEVGATVFLGWGLCSPSAGRGSNVSVPGKEMCSLTAEAFFIFQTISYLDRFAFMHVKGGSMIKHH